ncbi:MAG: MOSC domain-containing protein [Betaproteobacteria bacterium]|nr:MOSC domain-containing protein [Betaproteobacteria bacterium]
MHDSRSSSSASSNPSPSTAHLVGRVVGLWRYPVKSMAAEPLTRIDVSWHGFAGDRRWAFVRDGTAQSDFPWLTLRERFDLNHFKPSFVDPAQPDKSRTLVRTPGGAEYDVTDPALAAELWPQGARVIRQQRGVFDTFPLSLVSVQSIAALGARVGKPLAMNRFRPNLLIDTGGGAPFQEDEWVGRVLSVGGVRMRVDKRDGRCAVITVDPLTAERDADVLRVVAQERAGCLGVYASTVLPGRIALNDAVTVG